MKILLDQGTPVPLRHYLLDHEVTTAFELMTTSWPRIQLLIPQILAALDDVKPGALVEITLQ